MSSRVGRRRSGNAAGTLCIWRTTISLVRSPGSVILRRIGESRLRPSRPRISCSAEHLSSIRVRKSGCSEVLSQHPPISVTLNPSTIWLVSAATTCLPVWRLCRAITGAPPCSGTTPPPPVSPPPIPGSASRRQLLPLTSQRRFQIPHRYCRITRR